MTSRLYFFAASFSLIFTVATRAAQFTDKEIRQGYRDHAVIAKLRTDVSPDAAAAAEVGEGMLAIGTFSHVARVRALNLADTETVAAAVTRLRATGRYEYVEPDYLRKTRALPNDPRLSTGEQWSLNNFGQDGGTAGADIHALEGWNLQSSAANVVVAVIDSGLRTTHVEFANNLWRNTGEIPGNFRDDDADGYIDDVNGIDATVRSTTLAAGTPTDVAGHGTSVSSVIGAHGNDGIGMTGVAWRVQLMPLKFIDVTGYGSVSGSITCINYAIAHGAQVINGSYGDFSYSQSEYDALTRARDAGIIVVVAADNGSSNGDVTPNYPANYLLDNIVTVASSTRTDELSDFSNYGTGLIDLAAPGSSIYLCSNAGDSSYVTESGTSFATPHVTGAIALLKAHFPNDTYRETINRLLRSVDRLPSLNGKTATGGRLNLVQALGSTSTSPYNDDFAQRSLLVGESVTTRSSTRFSTRETGEPAHAGAAGNGSLWWTWVATRNGTATIDTAGSAIDTLLAVYTGNSVDALISVASNDDASASLNTSKVTFTAVAGTSYHIAVDSKGTLGAVVLHLSLLSVNDDFASAAPVAGRSFQVKSDNRSASHETADPKIQGKTGAHSVWYKWVAPVSRRYYVSAWCPTGDFNSMLGVYTGSTLSTLSEVVSGLTSGAGVYLLPDASASFQAVAGTTYYILVDSEDGKVGNFTLTLIDSDWEALSYIGTFMTPALGADGTIYSSDVEGYIYAFNPDGSLKWTSGLAGYCEVGGPAVAPDGTIYFVDTASTVTGTSGNYLYAYAPDGTQKWRFQTKGNITASPTLAADGTIYVRSRDGNLYAINPDGSKKWAFAENGTALSTAAPSIAPDGTIYIGSTDGSLYAINPDGSKKWAYATGGALFIPAAIAADGTVYVGGNGNALFAISADGTLKWSLPTTGQLDGAPVIGTDGTIYFGCYDDKLYAVTPDGVLRWTYDGGASFGTSAPVIASDGTIYAATIDGYVHAIDPNGARVRLFGTGDGIYSSLLLNNGMLYVASYDYRLYAINVGKVPASSAWPMDQQNIRRLGRAVAQTLAIGVAPVSQAAAVGSAATFAVGAVGTGNLSYQWRFNGTPISGATALSYTVDPALLTSAGQYTVVVTDSSGSVTSPAVPLSVSGGVTSSDSRLINLAARAVVGTGGDILIPGITVAGAGTKQLLIRAAGPALAAFGVTGVLAQPQLQLTKGGTVIASNTGWGTATNPTALSAAFAQVGAFGFAPNSGDCALLVTVDAGSYTAQISGVGGTTGVALVEVYEVGSTTSRLGNLSCRARVGTGGDILIPGITIAGSGPRQLLIRAAGPVLSAFGVTGALARPRLQVYSGSTKVAENFGWSNAGNSVQAAAAFAQVGAFSFAPGALDSALLVTLAPGSYTVQVSGDGATTGVALVEVYDVP